VLDGYDVKVAGDLAIAFPIREKFPNRGTRHKMHIKS